MRFPLRVIINHTLPCVGVGSQIGQCIHHSIGLCIVLVFDVVSLL